MHQIWFRFLRPRWVRLQHLPRPPSWWEEGYLPPPQEPLSTLQSSTPLFSRFLANRLSVSKRFHISSFCLHDMKVTSLRYLDAKFHHPSLGASPPNRGKSMCLPPELSLLLKRRSVNKFRHRYSMLWRLAIPALAGLLVFFPKLCMYEAAGRSLTAVFWALRRGTSEMRRPHKKHVDLNVILAL